jgi:isoquinoline 1-oxidoreductase subunit alpha
VASMKFTINGTEQTVDVHPDMPLLWVLRDVLNLTGTKFGCGIGLCGACTVHLDGAAIRSCLTSSTAVAGKHVTTIEGLHLIAVTHSNKPGWRNMSRSAATARPGRL